VNAFERQQERTLRLRLLARYDEIGTGKTLGDLDHCVWCMMRQQQLPGMAMPWLTGFQEPSHVFLHHECRDDFFANLKGSVE
jgi:hypothetical protein